MFGILSFFVCPFFGIAAWVMGNTDLQEMAAGRMDPAGRDMTQAGRICGMIGTIILIFQIVAIVLIGLVMAISRP